MLVCEVETEVDDIADQRVKTQAKVLYPPRGVRHVAATHDMQPQEEDEDIASEDPLVKHRTRVAGMIFPHGDEVTADESHHEDG